MFPDSINTSIGNDVAFAVTAKRSPFKYGARLKPCGRSIDENHNLHFHIYGNKLY